MSLSECSCFDEEHCLICGKSFEDNPSEQNVTVTRGIPNLIKFSLLRGHQELHNYLSSTPNAVIVHERCRGEYVKMRGLPKPDGIEENPRPAKKLRSHTDTFQWATCCLFCCDSVVVDDGHPERYGKIHYAQTMQLRDSILEVCSQRQDSWAVDVRAKLQLISDLPAADAVYHGKCYSLFFAGRKHPSELRNEEGGRQDDISKMKSFLDMCEWFESENDEVELCSLVEMREYMLRKSGDDASLVYSMQSIKRKLQEHYGDHVFFGESQGRRDIVCLRNMASFLINKKWYDERKVNAVEENEKIITAAAKLIRSQIKEHEYSTEFYPSINDIQCSEKLKDWVTCQNHLNLPRLSRLTTSATLSSPKRL